jgi:hypothetical protein
MLSNACLGRGEEQLRTADQKMEMLVFKAKTEIMSIGPCCVQEARAAV